jgi:hypothetical protein
MPLITALNGMNSQRVTRAISVASVVLPTPGGPKDDRRQLVALDLAAQRLAGPRDVLLPDVVFQALGAHALGKRAFGVGRPGLLRRSRVEEAHASGILWRRASYSRMPAATAAFSDSTPTVGMETSSAADRSSPLTPWPSLPMNQAAASSKVNCP